MEESSQTECANNSKSSNKFSKKQILEALDSFVSTSCPTKIDPKGPRMILEKGYFSTFFRLPKVGQRVVKKLWKSHGKVMKQVNKHM